MEHWAEPQGLKKSFRNNSDSPAAEVCAFLVLAAWLLHAHEPGFPEQSDRSFTAALADAGILHFDSRPAVRRATGAQADDADATLTLPRAAMFAILAKDAEQQKQNITIEGDQDVIGKLTEHMVTYDFFFNIVEP